LKEKWEGKYGGKVRFLKIEATWLRKPYYFPFFSSSSSSLFSRYFSCCNWGRE